MAIPNMIKMSQNPTNSNKKTHPGRAFQAFRLGRQPATTSQGQCRENGWRLWDFSTGTGGRPRGFLIYNVGNTKWSRENNLFSMLVSETCSYFWSWIETSPEIITMGLLKTRCSMKVSSTEGTIFALCWAASGRSVGESAKITNMWNWLVMLRFFFPM